MADDVGRLEIVFQANIDKVLANMDKMNAKINSALGQASTRVHKADDEWKKLFGEGPAAALDKVFNRSRFALVEEGGAKIGVFGNALESLGVTGIAAGAGLVIVAEALHEAGEALEFADNLDKTAKRAHVTTDELQELQYALKITGGDVNAAGGALESFQSVLAKAEAGIPRAQKAFLEMGFTPEQIKNLGTGRAALEKVIDRVQQFNGDGQSALYDQLGLSGIKTAFEDGAEGLKKMADQAHATGNVMDSDLVKRGAELNDQVETLQGKINVELKSAFVDLGPVLLNLLSFAATLASHVADIVKGIKEIAGGSDSVADLRRENAGIARKLAQPVIYSADQSPDEARAELTKKFADNESRIHILSAGGEGPASANPSGRGLVDPNAAKAADAAAKAALEARVRGEQAIADATKDEASAKAAGLVDLRDIADARQDVLDAELASYKTKLEGQVSEKKISRADADAAIAAETRAFDLKSAKNTRDEQDAEDERILSAQRESAQLSDELLSIAEGQAKTQAERRDIGLQLLAQERRVALQQLAGQRAIADRNGDSGEVSRLDGVIAQTKQVFDARFTDVLKGTEGPLEHWKDNVISTAAQAQEAFENVAVEGLNGITNALAGAIAGTQSLGSAFKQVAQQIIADLARIAIEKNVTAPLANLLGIGQGISFLPGFASGTNSAPGGAAIVGENGPELVNLPKGSQVIPNFQLPRMGGQGGTQANVNVSIDARGSTLDAAQLLAARLDSLERNLPTTIVKTVNDAAQRRRIN